MKTWMIFVTLFNLTLLTIKFSEYILPIIAIFFLFGLAYAFLTNLFTPNVTREEYMRRNDYRE